MASQQVPLAATQMNIEQIYHQNNKQPVIVTYCSILFFSSNINVTKLTLKREKVFFFSKLLRQYLLLMFSSMMNSYCSLH